MDKKCLFWMKKKLIKVWFRIKSYVIPWQPHAKKWHLCPLSGSPGSWSPSWSSSSSPASTSSPRTSRCCWCWSTQTPRNISPSPTSAQVDSHPEKSDSVSKITLISTSAPGCPTLQHAPHSPNILEVCASSRRRTPGPCLPEASLSSPSKATKAQNSSYNSGGICDSPKLNSHWNKSDLLLGLGLQPLGVK